MSSASRPSLYAESSKGMRAMLAALVERAGRTDFTDPVDVAGLRGAMRAAFELIEARTALEDRVIGPLLRAHAPASALEIASAHAIHRSRMSALMGRIGEAEWRRDGTPHALVVAIARFAADVGSHLADQEEFAMPALERVLDEGTLADVADTLDRAAPPEERLAWLRWTLPAMSHPERVARLRVLRGQSIHYDALAIARTVLEPDAWERLEIALTLVTPIRGVTRAA